MNSFWNILNLPLFYLFSIVFIFEQWNLITYCLISIIVYFIRLIIYSCCCSDYIVIYHWKSDAESSEFQGTSVVYCPSQATVSRQLHTLRDSVVSMGKGRNTRYALVKSAFGARDRIPLYAVDPHGNSVLIAIIRPLTHGGYLVERTVGAVCHLFCWEKKGMGYMNDDLPFFLDDLRPQRFLGRQIAQALSDSSGFPSAPSQ